MGGNHVVTKMRERRPDATPRSTGGIYSTKAAERRPDSASRLRKPCSATQNLHCGYGSPRYSVPALCCTPPEHVQREPLPSLLLHRQHHLKGYGAAAKHQNKKKQRRTRTTKQARDIGSSHLISPRRSVSLVLVQLRWRQRSRGRRSKDVPSRIPAANRLPGVCEEVGGGRLKFRYIRLKNETDVWGRVGVGLESTIKDMHPFCCAGEGCSVRAGWRNGNNFIVRCRTRFQSPERFCFYTTRSGHAVLGVQIASTSTLPFCYTS